MSQLLLVDLYNVATRAWHAITPLTLPDGRKIQAVRGSLSTIQKLIRTYPSDDLLIALDARPTHRLAVDDTYKAHRPPTDPDLKAQRKLLIDLLEKCLWPTLLKEGFEADDIIASAARQYPGEVLILSGDRDLLALCSNRVKVIFPNGKEPLGPEECLELMGVRPDQITDYKALVGDASDGIKGVPGIGPVRAKALLLEYDSLKEIYAHLSEIKPASVQNLLRENLDVARRSWQLVKMVDRLPIANSWKPLREIYRKECQEACETLGLPTLAPFFTVAPGVLRESSSI